jgi:uncharacterized protein YbjT (DUF2867 family)
MDVAVFGGTGGTGRALIATALAHGWAVRAFVRTQARPAVALPAGLDVVRGYPDRHEDVVATVRGVDAVCCVVGPRAEAPVPFCAALTRSIVDAMRAEGVRRLVCVTGAMIGELPRNVSAPMRALAAAFRRRLPEIAADRAAQEAIVIRSGLAWTLVKPPRLTDGEATGVIHADPALPVGLRSSVTRRDLAEFVFRAAAHNRFLDQRVYVHG